MTNIRKTARKKLMAFTPVYELKHKALIGYVADLTLKGAMVSGGKALEVNRQMMIGIEFPEAPPTMTAVRIVLPARVAWCRVDDSPQNFNIGFEFAEVSPENAHIIAAVLERYQFRSASSAEDLES